MTQSIHASKAQAPLHSRHVVLVKGMLLGMFLKLMEVNLMNEMHNRKGINLGCFDLKGLRQSRRLSPQLTKAFEVETS